MTEGKGTGFLEIGAVLLTALDGRYLIFRRDIRDVLPFDNHSWDTDIKLFDSHCSGLFLL